MQNIFDLTDLNDLTTSLRDKVKIKMTLCDKILYLFSIKSKLSYQEILIGLWRQYGVDHSSSLAPTLTNLKKRNLLKKISVGSYEKI